MPLRDLLRRRARLGPALRDALRGGDALEVGGPSRLFTRRGRLPLYGALARLDLLDLPGETIWDRGAKAPPDLPPGDRLRGEATELDRAAGRTYDAVLASHVLEHVANPLRALEAVRRVLGEPGHLLLVLPHPAGTFDHRRPVTTLAHLREDRDRDVGEDDATHVDEVLRLHDLARDPGAGDRRAFERRTRENARHRALHHHVFDPPAAVRMLDDAGFGVLGLEVVRPYHIVTWARADGTGRDAHARFFELRASWRRTSPFPRDRERA